MGRPPLGVTIGDVEDAIAQLLADGLPATAEDVGAIVGCGRTKVAGVVREATGLGYGEHRARFRRVSGVDGTPAVLLPDHRRMVEVRALVDDRTALLLRRAAIDARTSLAAHIGRLVARSLGVGTADATARPGPPDPGSGPPPAGRHAA